MHTRLQTGQQTERDGILTQRKLIPGWADTYINRPRIMRRWRNWQRARLIT